MKRSIQRALVAAGLALTLGAGSAAVVPSHANAEVHFKQLSFAEAKKLAAKEKKKIMVDFYTDWCGWCKVLDRKTYSDENVGKIADAKFISVKIDAEKGEGIALAKNYQVTGYPTIVFFSADGKEVDRVVGYKDAESFARALNLAAAGGTKLLMEEIGKGTTKDASKWVVAANYYAEHDQTKEAINAFKKAMEYDPDNTQRIHEEAQYGLAFLSDAPEKWDALQRAVAEHPDREEAQQAVMMLVKHDIEEGNPNDGLQQIETWAMHHPDDQNMFNFFAWTAAEKGVLLEKAEEYATRAVDISRSPQERASALDTKAEIVFKLGRGSQAVQLEDEAIGLLDPQKDQRLYAQLKQQKSKFQIGAAPAGSDGGVNGPVPTPQIAH